MDIQGLGIVDCGVETEDLVRTREGILEPVAEALRDREKLVPDAVAEAFLALE